MPLLNRNTGNTTIKNIQKLGTASPRVVGARPTIKRTIANVAKKDRPVVPTTKVVHAVAPKSPVVNATPGKSTPASDPAPAVKVVSKIEKPKTVTPILLVPAQAPKVEEPPVVVPVTELASEQHANS